MKKNIILLFLILSIALSLKAQESTAGTGDQNNISQESKEKLKKQKGKNKYLGKNRDSQRNKRIYYAEFNASEKKPVQIPYSVPENSLLVTRIKNVNPFVTKLFIKTSFVEVAFLDGEDVFMQLIGQKTEKATQQAVNNPNNEMGVKDSTQTKPKNTTIAESQLSNCLVNFWKHRQKWMLFLGLDTSLYNLTQQPIISLEQLKSQLHARLICFGLDTTSTPCDVDEKIETLLNNLFNDYNCILQHYNQIQKFDKVIEPILKVTPDKKSKDTKMTVEVLTQLKDTVQSTPYDTIVAIVKSFIRNITNDSVSAKIQQKTENITKVLEAVNNSGPFILESTPQPVLGDTFYFSPTIKSLKGDTLFHVNSIPILTYGGKRTDFSTGVAFNFGGLLNETFRIERINSNEFRIKKNDQLSQLTPSLAAFVHMYRKAKSGSQFAYSFGFSANPVNLEKTTFYAGCSILHIAKERIAATIGIAAGEATRLVARFNNNATYSYADHSGLQDTDLIENKFRLGLFCAFSYNLTKRK